MNRQTYPGRSAIEQRRANVACKMFGEGWGATPGWRKVWEANATADMVGYFNGEPEPNRGRDAFIRFQQELFEGFPDLKTEVIAVIVEDDKVVVQSVLDGLQTGPFLGVPPSNNRVRVPDVTVFGFEGEKIREVRYFTDLLRVMSAIGALP
ncbi:MAG: ester cyclase [Inquilinaceae bacterium]